MGLRCTSKYKLIITLSSLEMTDTDKYGTGTPSTVKCEELDTN